MITQQSSSDPESQVVFHVAAMPIEIGQAIRPYAITPESLVRLGLRHDTPTAGLDADRDLIDAALRFDGILAGVYGGAMVLLEAIFERVRLLTAPALPGRLGAVFGWSTPVLAKRYLTGYQPGGIIHRCRIVSGNRMERDGALVVEAFELANLANPEPGDLRLVEERAERYWLGRAPMAFPELIVHGTVVVEAHIDPADGQLSGPG